VIPLNEKLSKKEREKENIKVREKKERKLSVLFL